MNESRDVKVRNPSTPVHDRPKDTLVPPYSRTRERNLEGEEYYGKSERAYRSSRMQHDRGGRDISGYGHNKENFSQNNRSRERQRYRERHREQSIRRESRERVPRDWSPERRRERSERDWSRDTGRERSRHGSLHSYRRRQKSSRYEPSRHSPGNASTAFRRGDSPRYKNREQYSRSEHPSPPFKSPQSPIHHSSTGRTSDNDIESEWVLSDASRARSSDIDSGMLEQKASKGKMKQDLVDRALDKYMEIQERKLKNKSSHGRKTASRKFDMDGFMDFLELFSEYENSKQRLRPSSHASSKSRRTPGHRVSAWASHSDSESSPSSDGYRPRARGNREFSLSRHHDEAREESRARRRSPQKSSKNSLRASEISREIERNLSRIRRHEGEPSIDIDSYIDR